MNEQIYDYVIIGSGFGGSVSAMRLSVKGYSVLVLEKGKRFEDKDFAKTNWQYWKYLWMPFLRAHGILQISILKGVMVLHGAGVGGGSLGYANVLEVPTDETFATPAWNQNVKWGELDVLLVDMPPGSERLDTLAELVPGLRGALVVTIPSEASYRAVRRAVEAARAARVTVLGVVENMAGYRCGACSATGPLFDGDAGERLSRDAEAPLLARVPFDPRWQAAIDGGHPGFVADALAPLASALWSRLDAPAASVERA